MKPPTITYRLYRPQDRKQVETAMAAMQDHFIKFNPWGWLRRTRDFGRKYTSYLLRDLKKHQGRMFMAMDGDTVVGLITAVVEKQHALAKTYVKPGERFGWLELLYVDSRYRRHGIGTDLLQFAENYLNEKQCTVIRLEAQGDTAALAKFYQRAGYKVWFLNMAKRLRQPKGRA